MKAEEFLKQNRMTSKGYGHNKKVYILRAMEEYVAHKLEEHKQFSINEDEEINDLKRIYDSMDICANKYLLKKVIESLSKGTLDKVTKK